MAFDPKNKEHINQAYKVAAEDRIGAYYSSTGYNNALARYEARRDAYYRKAVSGSPVWASKLYFPVFYLGVQALHSQFIKAHRKDPFCWVTMEDGSTTSAETHEQAALANYDLNHDLYVGNFKAELYKMYWFAEVFGTCVGREYIRSDQEEIKKTRIAYDRMGVEQKQSETTISRLEHTKTDCIHPLNFAQEGHKSELYESRWVSVRYPMPVSSLYKLQKSEDFDREAIADILKQLERGGAPLWNSNPTSYYSDRASESQINSETVIIDEYSGDLPFAGNYDDNGLYFIMIVRQFNKIIRIGKSPFRRHPYWKMRPVPDPVGPYGYGPCDPLLPLGLLKNDIFNSYVDWTHANQKYMYEVLPDYVSGGLTNLLQGLPGGLVIAATENAWKAGPLVRAVQKDRGSLPGISDIISFIKSEEQSEGPSSNLRGKSSEQLNDTATGIGLMAQREDESISGLQENIDIGIEDACLLKLQNRIDFMTQPVQGRIDDQNPAVRYFPSELSGINYNVKVQRTTPDMQAGKYMSALQLGMKLMEIGAVDAQGIAQLAKVVMRAMDIDEADEIFKAPMPPQIPGPSGPAGMPEMAAPGPGQTSQAQPVPMPMPAPPPQLQGVPGAALAA